jgi:transcription-repair coupling factor (superfamily II helicase)
MTRKLSRAVFSVDTPLVLRDIEALLENAGAGTAVEVYGAAGAMGAAIAAHLARQSKSHHLLLYLVAGEELVEARCADLSFFLAPRKSAEDPLAALPVLDLPAPEVSPHAEMQPDRRTVMRRLALLFRLGHGHAPAVVVASAAAVFRRVIPPREFADLCRVVEGHSTVDRERLIRDLCRAGYGRAQVVEDPGTFAVRGAVIDVFPPVYRHPVRIELFGDEVESLRLYDAATQRTLRPIDRVALHPVRETVATAGADTRSRLLAAADQAAYPSSKTRYLLEQIERGEDFFGSEALAPIFHARLGSFFDYLAPKTRVVVEDPPAILEEARRSFSRVRESAVHRRAEHRIALDAEEFLLDEEQARLALCAWSRLELRAVEVTPPSLADTPPSPQVRVTAEPNTSLRAELLHQRSDEDLGHALCERIRRWHADGYRVCLVAPSRAHADRLAGVLQAFGLSPEAPRDHSEGSAQGLLTRSAAPPSLHILVGPLTRGFRLPDDRLALVAEEEIFGARAHREAPPATTPAFGDLAEIAEGDLVVHDEQGVGRYRGLKKLTLRGVAHDFLHLEYQGGSLYVPVYRIGVVHRFVGGTPETVRLDKLGGATWVEKRRRVSAEARKLAEDLLQLYAQRQALPGHAFPPPDVVFREFEETFPFEETADQDKAIAAVLADMQAEAPMDRLVCGDVGYGKTEVALRASLLAALGGRQVAVLAPTTVLVEQHAVTFAERLRDFPVQVASLSRFRSKHEQRDTIAALATGKLDIVIGTHRLLSRDVHFRNLGLLIIDEEQRFGVTHKERLKEMRSQVDVLTLTATPIPRTLQMAMSGLREISIIATPPADRLAIRTFVCGFDPDLLREAIAKELARGGQVFFVHNRVEDLPKWTREVSALAPGARVAMAHGQMPEAKLEQVMIDFVDGRYDILCCTTIIESGLDIPRANTMIVNHADRYGLAQLYQLRGRIGRSKERAFCYLVIAGEGALSAQARQRLEVLQRFTELGAGFQVATHDLEIRGAGEMLGDRQSGLLAAVGFDTYARILEEAVAELRGQPIRNEFDPEIAVDVPAFLPDDYIPDMGQRLDFYRRLAQARDDGDVRATLAELEDRYGPLPEEARLLGEVMSDKTLVRRTGARAYELTEGRLVLSAGVDARLDPTKIMRLVQHKGSRWKLSPDMRLSYAFDDEEKRDHLAAARKRLQDVLACVAG